MQNANRSVFQSAWLPTKGANADEEPIEALVRAMTTFSSDEIEALEDEINFFAFTGLKGSLMRDILRSAKADGTCPNPSASSGSNQKSAEERGEFGPVVSSPDKVLACSHG